MQPYIGNYVSSYGLFASIGLFAMMLISYFRNKKLSFVEFLLLEILMVIGAVLGSKLMFIISQIPDIIMHFSIKYMAEKIITSGFVFYGGLFGAILGCIFFSKIKDMQKMELLNFVAPGYAIFHAFGRIGCFFAGCCYGKKADWGFALWDEPGVLRVPIQLIESIFLFGLAIVLLVRERRNKNDIFKLYMLSYAIFRFIIEFWRGDMVRGIWGTFSTSQWISVFIIVVSFIFEIRMRLKCVSRQ